jgi:hypothetical protein
MRPNYNTRQVKEAIRTKYAWPGGYPLFLFTSDGATLCIDCGRSKWKQICFEMRHPERHNQFQVICADVNWEDTNMYCAHCNEKIESAYGDDENE